MDSCHLVERRCKGKGWQHSAGVLRCLWCLLLALFPIAHGATIREDASLRSITTAQEVRQLPAQEAERGHPVVLRGVILHFNENADFELMMQDDTAAIYVGGTAGRNYKFRPGQSVQIIGVTSPGEFAPMVVASDIKVLGEGRLPAPREKTFEQLATGAEDGQWVRISGIVRSATLDRLSNYSRLSLDLATGGHRLTVRIPNVDAMDLTGLIDCEATVTGICFPAFNRKRQLLTVRLCAPSLAQVSITRPLSLVSFDSQVRTINSLFQFEPQVPHGHRVKVQGVVTLHVPGQYLFIRDQTQGLWVKSAQTNLLSPGDEVEVLGFPALGDYNPVLEDATFIKSGTALPRRPLPISVEQAGSGDFDAELVQLEATVLSAAQSMDEATFVLQERDSIFRAHLPLQDGLLPSFRPNSRLRLSGICLTQAGSDRAPRSFRLLPRGLEDVQIVSQPSWWTLQRAAWALGTMAIVFSAAMVWVLTLRRQVWRQTTEIQRKLEREAVLEERTRIAREFHDTIEQQLAAVTLQVHAARVRLVSAPELASNLLQFAERMLRHTKSEARSSVWDLRARALEGGGLESAMRTMADYVRNGSTVEISVSVSGDAFPIAGQVENHLLRLGQEATANAVKHAEAKRICLELRYAAQAVQLIVQDDGKGFEIPTATLAQVGHFGLLGMKERAEKIGGELQVASAPGAGTRIAVIVPRVSAASVSGNGA